MSNILKLKECPFCGTGNDSFPGKLSTQKGPRYEGTKIICMVCGIQTRYKKELEDLYRCWNTRPCESNLEKKIEEYESTLKLIADEGYLHTPLTGEAYWIPVNPAKIAKKVLDSNET